MDSLRAILKQKDTEDWLKTLEAEGIWCSDVMDYKTLLAHESYEVLKMDQELRLESGEKVHTTRCPIRLDDKRLFSPKPAPRVGQHTGSIRKEFNL